MTVHDLGGGAKVEVQSIKAVFKSRTPKQEVLDGDKTLTFTKPDDTGSTADIAFFVKTTGVPPGFTFGVKQFCTIDFYTFAYKGMKPQDGTIFQRFRPPERDMLDVSPTRLDMMFDTHNIPTGATAVAAHAPFYSQDPQSLQNGLIEIVSIADSPGGNFPLELRNVSTDRRVYLDDIDIKQTFLTVLTAVRPDATHVPLVAQRWQNRIQGKIVWNAAPVAAADAVGVVHTNTGLGVFPSIGPDFLLMDFSLIKNNSLSASDSVIQKFHSALFTVRHTYRTQDFTKPTNKEVQISSQGYELTQRPL